MNKPVIDITYLALQLFLKCFSFPGLNNSVYIAYQHNSKNVIQDPEITKALADILNSEAFLKSQHNKLLLEYLVKATLEKRDIKEYTIAHEIFKKETDTGVRAYIHNLRKKLDEYYSGEGKNSELILSIPKGQYYVQVNKREVEKEKEKGKGPGLPKRYVWGLLGILFVAGLSLVWFLWNSDNSVTKSVIWSDVLSSQDPLLVVIGDHYFYKSGIATAKEGVVRDFTINSEAELDSWLATNKNELKDSISKINFTYVTKEGVMSAFKLSPYLKNTPEAQIILSSELTYEQIKHNNILFVGKYNTLGILNSVTDKKYFHRDSFSNKLDYFLKDSIVHKELQLGPTYKDDYSIVLKFRTPYQKTVMMFVSGDDPGIAATLDYFLDLKNVDLMTDKLELTSRANSFSGLFRVEGLGRTDYSIRYMAGEKIK